MIASARARLGAYLGAAATFNQEGIVNSNELAVVVGLNATQVRRDLSTYEVTHGKRGVGYPVAKLVRGLAETLQGDATGAAAILASAESERAYYHFTAPDGIHKAIRETAANLKAVDTIIGAIR